MLYMLYMLDTDIVSYLIKGKLPTAEKHLLTLAPSAVCISVITRAELLYGLKRLAADHRLHMLVGQFLDMTRTLPWDVSASNWFADIRYQLLESGQPIGELDMMIAAHSLAMGAVLVTNNRRHYERIKASVILENWA